MRDKQYCSPLPPHTKDKTMKLKSIIVVALTVVAIQGQAQALTVEKDYPNVYQYLQDSYSRLNDMDYYEKKGNCQALEQAWVKSLSSDESTFNISIYALRAAHACNSTELLGKAEKFMRLHNEMEQIQRKIRGY
jgi:hypothetical protein